MGKNVGWIFSHGSVGLGARISSGMSISAPQCLQNAASSAWSAPAHTWQNYLVEKYQEESGEIGENVIDWIRDPTNDANILYYVKKV